MFTRKTKEVIYIYCEGDSEKKYFEALKGNPLISKNYVLKPNSKENDLANAIKKSEKLEGINIIIIYVYDSDSYKKHKKITPKIELNKQNIYFSEEEIEDFLDCHNAKPIYKDKKPNLSRHIINEIKEMDLDFIQKSFKKPKKFKGFKSIYDLLNELFQGKK